MTLTITLDESTMTTLRAAAEAREISSEELARQAINDFLDYDRWFHQKVQNGVRAYEEGHYLSQEEASRLAAERRAKLLGKAM